jgi:hypothetical protein
MAVQVSSSPFLNAFPEFIRPTLIAVFGNNIPAVQMPALAVDASANEKKDALLLATKSLLQGTIETKMKTLPPDEISILQAKHGLARTYSELGQEKDAEEEYVQLLQYSEKYHNPHFHAV